MGISGVSASLPSGVSPASAANLPAASHGAAWPSRLSRLVVPLARHDPVFIKGIEPKTNTPPALLRTAGLEAPTRLFCSIKSLHPSPCSLLVTTQHCQYYCSPLLHCLISLSAEISVRWQPRLPGGFNLEQRGTSDTGTMQSSRRPPARQSSLRSQSSETSDPAPSRCLARFQQPMRFKAP